MRRLGVVLGLVLVAFTSGGASTAELTVDQAVLAGGKLTIRGRTAKPNQVVEIVGTNFKTVSLRSRRFSMVVSYLPDTCKVHLRAEDDNLEDQPVSGCSPRGPAGRECPPGKDGAPGKNGAPGKDGKDGKDGLAYGGLPGDNAAFKCWPSDVIGLWFIKDYPARNSRTIAHIVPDLAAGGNTFRLTEPNDPLKSQKPEGPALPQWAEYDNETIHILNRNTKSRTGVRGELAPDCRSISWKGEGNRFLTTWVR
jgi:hypothetical protein